MSWIFNKMKKMECRVLVEKQYSVDFPPGFFIFEQKTGK